VAEVTESGRLVRVTTAQTSRLPEDAIHRIDTASPASDPGAHHVLVGGSRPATHDRPAVIEVVVDGWRFELEVEGDARATLRERATREPDAASASGPLEIRAIIPGRVVSVAAAVGDLVEAGDALLVLEAMKMQNELRTPRAGRVTRVGASAGRTVEIGDLLVVVE
jgi:biotin carboxyl carrier protein